MGVIVRTSQNTAVLFSVISVPHSAKLSHSFPKQHCNAQNVAELELDILDARLLEEVPRTFYRSDAKRLSLLVYQLVYGRWLVRVILR